MAVFILVACGNGGDNGTDVGDAAQPSPSPGTTTARVYEEGTVAGILSRDGRFTVLMRVLETAEVRDGPPPGTVTGSAAEVMSQPGWDHTIFAPTDAAFDAVDEITLESLFQSAEATGIVRTHVVPMVIRSDERETGQLLAIGGPIEVVVDGSGIMYGGATVVEPDIEASNGVIHVVDAVILP